VNREVKMKLKSLTKNSGVYKFLDARGSVIYIGKAKNIKSRVGSYFNSKIDPATKTALLVDNIAGIEVVETLSELEALILEAELIKKFKPKFNIALKDDKSHIYIVLRSQKERLDGKSINLPTVLAVRRTDLREKDVAFGPYPNSSATKFVVRTVRRIFPYRDCSKTKFNRHAKLGHPCLYGDIGLCSAPCVGRVSPEDYRKEIKKIEKLLSGKSISLINSLERSMNTASKNQQYEKAAEIRDTLEKFRYVRTKSTVAQKYIDNPYLVQDKREKAMEEIEKAIPTLKKLPEKIECYDISNISGTDSVGSMVVAVGGEILKSEYRRFRIKRKKTPDDFYMMEEVITRRLKNNWPIPDLIVVDGGKGQVGAAVKALNETNSDIPVVGLAKKFETLIIWEDGIFSEINLSRDNEGLKLLQRLRDESHRFAQSYHHRLRLKRINE
jgi:excinuclease ABC subunit C